jgi:hypothetical protein
MNRPLSTPSKNVLVLAQDFMGLSLRLRLSWPHRLHKPYNIFGLPLALDSVSASREQEGKEWTMSMSGRCSPEALLAQESRALSGARWRWETTTTRVFEAVFDAVRQGGWATSGCSVIALLMVQRAVVAVVAAVAASTVGGRLS